VIRLFTVMPVKTGIQLKFLDSVSPPAFAGLPTQFVDFVESIEQLFGFRAKPKPARHSAVILHLGQYDLRLLCMHLLILSVYRTRSL
jgi:hypothetical protein